MKTLNLIIATALFLLAAHRHSLAGSATWATNPSSGDWNTAANWTPHTVPNTSSDIATFATSNQKQVGISAITGVSGINFNPGADSFTISSEPGDPLTLSGSGIVNNSGKLQTFLSEINGGFAGGVIFMNSSTAGDMTSFGGSEGSVFIFYDTSSAGSAAFDLGGGTIQSSITFWDSSTAADSTINVTLGAINFFGDSTAANARMTVSGSSILFLLEDARGGNAVATCFGGKFFGNNIAFADNATAEQGTYTAVGASTTGEFGSFIEFLGNATADRATFVVNGGMGAGLEGTSLDFVDTTTAAAANITANGGVSGGVGGVIMFEDKAKGGKASITLNGNGELDISSHRTLDVTIGSLAGQGLVFLGANTLTIGSNNQSTTFSGVIQDSGGVTKSGAGTLTLSGANTYTGSTTVSAGGLVANNKRGSATGAGNVTVQAGSLGGKGIISGAVIVGSGSGSGALLVPGLNAKSAVTLTIQSSLTFNSDGTLQERLSTRQAKADGVLANGVTINGAAQFTLQPIGQKKLASGTRFTLISNTSANPISGAFSDLPDGGTITVGSNTFQANYKGGDGNDLTLTVQ